MSKGGRCRMVASTGSYSLGMASMTRHLVSFWARVDLALGLNIMALGAFIGAS